MEDKTNTPEVYLTYITVNDSVSGYGKGERDFYYEGSGSYKKGSYVCVDTGEYEKLCTGKFTFFTSKHIYNTVPCLKPIGVYARYDGNCLYEMVTGKEMKKWSEGKPYEFDKYVYYDHLVEAELKNAAEELQYVNIKDSRIKQFTERLIKKQQIVIEERARKAEKEAKANREENAVKTYINNYKRPNR